MRKFIYTSHHLEGEVVFGFDEDSLLLVLFDIRDVIGMTEEQRVAFLTNLPRELAQLEWLVKQKPNERFMKEIKEVPTFEQMWIRYNHKRLSSKKKSLVIWNRMKDLSKIGAYDFYPQYEKEVTKQGISKKHLETYLHAELWEN